MPEYVLILLIQRLISLIVDMSGSTKNFDNVNEDLNKLGEDIGVVIKCQREEIFDMMHRI